MARKLTKKQRDFVDAYAEKGNGTQAALAVYDTDDEDTAGVIASENLGKPKIQEALVDKLSEEKVLKAHTSLLDGVRLDYFVFSKSMKDEEIISHVESQGLVVINVRQSDKGKLAFYSLPDAHARGKGVELYYKLKGSFAPEKHVNLNADVEIEATERDLATRLLQQQTNP